MEAINNSPKTLQEAIQHFSNAENCINYLIARRPEWSDGVICPTCGSKQVSFLKNQLRWQCSAHHPKRQFSIKVGTIFEDSPLGLDKWLPCVWLITNAKNGISSHEIGRALGVTQKTAWFMLHRVRLAHQDTSTGGKLGGEVEVDETFIGGKARNMHGHKRAQKIKGRGPEGKAVVAAVLERGGKVRAKVVATRKKRELQSFVRENVETGSTVYSDFLLSYEGLSADYTHRVIDHAVEYVRENVHTNSAENFWSLLKRGINGTYVSVEPFHLFRYVDEQAFRFNTRLHEDGEKITDGERFDIAVRQIVGKRLTYEQLTGHSLELQS
jgi:transposase-like protein